MRETKMQEIRRRAREQTEEDVAAAYREYRKEKGLDTEKVCPVRNVTGRAWL